MHTIPTLQDAGVRPGGAARVVRAVPLFFPDVSCVYTVYLEHSQGALERNPHPIKAIVEFIVEFVQGLVQHKRFEQGRQIMALGRHKARASSRREITLHKAHRDPVLPIGRPWLEPAHILWACPYKRKQ